MANNFTIHTLGCGSAKPTLRHQPSCTVVSHRGRLFMIDCGEGAQLAMQRHKLQMSRLKDIFITHLHGDHVLGLPGLVSTLSLGGTGGSLTIHTFEEGKRILENIFSYFCRDLSFSVIFNIIDPRSEAMIYEDHALAIRTLPLRHRVDDVGFVFEEKSGPRHLNRAMADFYGVPTWMFNRVKAGEDYVREDGSVVPNGVITTDPTPARSYAHISDTAYMPGLGKKIGPVDLLFHETTYLDDQAAQAKARYHSTARQAASVALEAGAKALLTGHYSSRYDDDSGFLREAREVFPNVILNREGLVTDL